MKKKYRNVNIEKSGYQKYNKGICGAVLLSLAIITVLIVLLVNLINEPTYVIENNYNVLDTLTIVKLILCFIGIFVTFFFASILISYINNKKKKCIENYIAFVEAENIRKENERKRAEEERQKREAERERLEIIKMQSAEEDDMDEDKENRKKFLQLEEYKDVEKAFVEFFLDKGIVFKNGIVSDILSSMACSRIVFIQGLSEVAFEKFSELLSGLFNGENFLDVLVDTEENPIEEFPTEFFNWIKQISNNSVINVASLSCQSADLVEKGYAEFTSAMIIPEKNNTYSVDDEEDVVIPNTIWYFVADYNKVGLPQNLLKYSSIVNLDDRNSNLSVFDSFVDASIEEILENSNDEEEQDLITKAYEVYSNPIELNANLPVSFFRFNEIIYETISQNSLSLTMWNKLDMLGEYLKKANLVYFDNRVCRQIEKYIAFELISGLTEKDAVDRLIANKVLPFIMTIPDECWKDNEEGISDFLDRVFGLQDLPLSERYITETMSIISQMGN